MSTPFLETIDLHAQQALRPLVTKIDQEGFYPESYLKALGTLGGFSAFIDQQTEVSGLATQIAVIQSVGRECGATAFSAWCQSACAWYLYKTPRREVQEKYLHAVTQGEVLAGTGMSNTIKHLSKIEKHLLQAEKVAGGYRVNGILPWVSNIGEDHIWAATAQVSDDQFVMFMVSGRQEGVKLNPCPQFSALEGTNTFAVRFTDLFVPESDLLADIAEFDDYITAIKPGFILLQIGIGAGIIEGCIQIMQESDFLTAHVNRYLDLSALETSEKLASLKTETDHLAQQVETGSLPILPILKTRLKAAEITLAAAQSAALHAGAKGYLMRHSAQRRSREALFVAIVTPAIKHLRQDIARLSS